MTERSIFLEALTRAPAERNAFLDEACAGQPELRDAVDTLNTYGYTEYVALHRELRSRSVKTCATADTFLAFSYLRFSSSAQADGDSVRRQTDLRDAWLKRNPNVQLDTSLTLVDAGVSGYSGQHRTNKKHHLALFLDMVERGRVPAGSFLIVEALDRLTRENPVESIPAVLGIIRSGIRVVQLVPNEMVYHADMELPALMAMLFELSRGFGESKRKSGLSGEAWVTKKKDARTKRTPHGPNVPAWLELRDGKYRVREDAGRAVRRIFRLCREGLGTLAITQRLNTEGVPPIARGKRWIRSYVAKILDNRATLGEYQPMKGHRGRVADGEPVPNYFPAVITEAGWHAAHQAKQDRTGRSGRPSSKETFAFPFSGLLRCARDRCTLRVIRRWGKAYLISTNAVLGERGSTRCPFPVEPFSKAILSRLVELQATDLFSDPAGDKIAQLCGRLAEVDRRLAVAVERFDADPESPTWANQVTKYDREKRELARELAEARQEAACPASAAWAEAVALMAENEPERLRQALLSTVDEIWCLFVRTKCATARVAAAQCWFKGGAHRDYLVWYDRPQGGAVPKREERCEVRSLADVGKLGDLDLRRAAHVKALEAELLELDLERFTKK
jgi:DNA invertase Pin-like site-specific DNA recombinase